MLENVDRGVSIETDELVFGHYWTDGEKHFIREEPGKDTLIYPESFGKPTGKRDYNGTSIYSNDTCKFKKEKNGAMCWVGNVEFKNCLYYLHCQASDECPYECLVNLNGLPDEWIEVIEE